MKNKLLFSVMTLFLMGCANVVNDNNNIRNNEHLLNEISTNEVASISFSQDVYTLYIGRDLLLTPTVHLIEKISWKCNSTLYASFDSNSSNSLLIKGIKEGSFEVTAYYKNISDTVTVNVIQGALADSTNLVVDGSLSDWDDYHTVSIQGLSELDNHKKAIFYGSLTSSGLFLALDAYHDIYLYNDPIWHLNTNFEFFIGNLNSQYYVYSIQNNTYASNLSLMQFSFNTEVSDNSNYHTYGEIFIPLNVLSYEDYKYCYINVGVAFKTIGDLITGGEANAGNEDEYWVPKGSWTNNNDKCIVDETGIYLKSEY